MKKLYKENGVEYNYDGMCLSKEIERAIKPILNKFISEGFYPPEISDIVHGTIQAELCMSRILNNCGEK